MSAPSSMPSVPASSQLLGAGAPAASAPGLPVYLTAQDVADSLKVDAATAYRWAKLDRSMPVTRIGGVIRFELRAITRWLEARARRQRADTRGAADL